MRGMLGVVYDLLLTLAHLTLGWVALRKGLKGPWRDSHFEELAVDSRSFGMLCEDYTLTLQVEKDPSPPPSLSHRLLT